MYVWCICVCYVWCIRMVYILCPAMSVSIFMTVFVVRCVSVSASFLRPVSVGHSPILHVHVENPQHSMHPLGVLLQHRKVVGLQSHVQQLIDRHHRLDGLQRHRGRSRSPVASGKVKVTCGVRAGQGHQWRQGRSRSPVASGQAKVTSGVRADQGHLWRQGRPRSPTSGVKAGQGRQWRQGRTRSPVASGQVKVTSGVRILAGQGHGEGSFSNVTGSRLRILKKREHLRGGGSHTGPT